MELDATRVTSGETIETELCIIGAGPAGLVVGAELAARGRDVVLLESGGGRDDSGAQALNDGELIGDSYAGLRATRQRGLGGTALLWNTPTPHGAGAKYVPLDPWDFTARAGGEGEDWPISYDDLAPFYARAQRLCGLGPLAYEAESWATRAPDAASVSPLVLEGSELVSRVYQMGGRAALVEPLLAALRASSTTRLYTGSTVVQLAATPRGGVVTVARGGGDRWTVRARRVVLAAGAVENARLLLLAESAGGGVEDHSGWLGRGFMEHPRDRVLTLTLSLGTTYGALAFYDAHRGADGTTIVGRLALSAAAASREELLNGSATLLPNLRPVRARLRAALGKAGTTRALRRWLPPPGHGWSSHPAPERVFDGFTVLLNVEQPPHRDNAVVLSARRDTFGTPLPALHWGWHAGDHRRLVRLRAVVAGALERAGVGRVSAGADVHPDPNAHHHAGTTRMHADARRGVVDADGRVHGTEGLFVVGASSFPTAGFANPVLTVVAMALRLADHLGDGG